MDDIGGLIGEGFRTWQKNLVLAVPFILAAVLTPLALLPFLTALVGALGSIEEIEAAGAGEILAGLEASMPALASALAVSFVLALLVGSFFTAGALSMALEAAMRGKTSLGTMVSGGRRHLIGMFILSVLMGVISLAGAVFLLPWAASVPWADIEGLVEVPGSVALLAAGVILFALWALAVSLVLALAPYALVADGTGPLEAVRRSTGIFRRNPLDVFILWMAVLALSMAVPTVGNALASEGAEALQISFSVISALVNVAILEPLAAVWWGRLYLSRAGRLERDGDEALGWD